MFASLPNLADKAFVIGFVLPTLIATLTLLFLFNDVAPFKAAYVASHSIKTFSELGALTLAMWAAATLLLFWNEWQYRFLEGYVGPFKRKAWREKVQNEILAKRTQLDTEKNILTDPGVADELKLAHYAKRRDLFQNFPVKPQLALPTRFGNVIRAFETYPEAIYGVEAIPAWLRLQAVVPKDFATSINDTRSAVDFFVNVWFLGVLIAALAVGREIYGLTVNCVWYGGTHFSCLAFPWAKFLWVALGAVIAVWIAYRGAVASAVTWGDAVKSAFNLYLPALAQQLGYQLPADDVDRRLFWGDVNNLFLYRTAMPAGRWKAVDAKEPTRRRFKGFGG
jgi:hypothetical protein